MDKKTLVRRLLTGAALCMMLFVFFRQANIALHPVDISFSDTEIAYGYSDVVFSGRVYNDQGVTAVSAGSGVAIHINGAATSTTTTNASGDYSFTGLTISEDDIVTVFINNEVEDGVLVGKFDDEELSDQSVTGMDIYADRLILRSSQGNRNITTTNLDLANNVGDADVDAVYSITGTDLYLKKNKELYIWSGTTHTSSGSIHSHDLEVLGTLTLASSADMTLSGSLVVPGTLTTTGDITLTSYASGEVLQVNSSALNNLYVDYGLQAYFRFDEGTGAAASSATLNSSTSGTISGAQWVQTNTGTTTFFNKHALEFDGSDDYVAFGDAYDINDSSQQTFAAWFRRKSADSEDVIFSKKTASGASTAGYMLWVDDEADTLMFEIANGTNNYLVTSTSTITDQNWHHIAVSYNPGDTQAINIFLDGAIDTASKSGSLESGGALSGTFGNAVEFFVGKDGGGTNFFDGTIDDLRIYNRAMSGAEISVLGTGEKTSGSGTYYINSDIDINGDFCVYAGTVDVGTGYTMNIAGDYCAYAGELKTNSGSVTLDGTDQVIRGSTAFNQLAKTSSTSVTLTFEVNTQQTVSGALTLQGALSKQMDLVSTRTGSQSHLIVEDSGATILTYLDVKDNNAASGQVLYCTEGCIDRGNNLHWVFLADCGDGVVGGSEQCDDGNSNNNDACPNDCRLAVCGDNVLEGEEECEPPNSGSCQSNCLLRTAGGGGGRNTGRTSSAASSASFSRRPPPPDGCGNGVLQEDLGEECDEGTRFNGIGTCSYDCKTLACGDGIISPQIGEDCEPTIKEVKNGNVIYEVAACGEICTAPEVSETGVVFGGCRRAFLPQCDEDGTPHTPQRPAAPVEGVCGNGTVESGEECDYGGVCNGGTFDKTFWTDAIAARNCITGGGNPLPQSGDGCSEQCMYEFCGDGVVQKRGSDNQVGTNDDEQCDNGSVCSNNKTKPCRLNSECASGGTCVFNEEKNRACTKQCKAVPPSDVPPPTRGCGNGKVEIGEECDKGEKNGAEGSECSLICTRVTQREEAPDIESDIEAMCGDGVLQAPEQCDEGEENSDIRPNACRTNCTRPMCGDFVIDAGEQCDNGFGNSDTKPDSCRTDCRLPQCGDTVVDSGEECDGGEMCQENCRFPKRITFCGNGVIEAQEECDDGNRNKGDGCSSKCTIETFVQAGTLCGNGVVDDGEECDDGNANNEDSCLTTCKVRIPRSAPKPKGFSFEADVVVVNPREFANALRYTETEEPCATLVIKGMNQKAENIVRYAEQAGIPIVRNIVLARSLYTSVKPGEKIVGTLCAPINRMHPIAQKQKPAAPEPEPTPPPIPSPSPSPSPIPTPSPYPLAQLQPLVVSRAPVGDTGPAAVGIVIAGAASGIGWMRRKRRGD